MSRMATREGLYQSIFSDSPNLIRVILQMQQLVATRINPETWPTRVAFHGLKHILSIKQKTCRTCRTVGTNMSGDHHPTEWKTVRPGAGNTSQLHRVSCHVVKATPACAVLVFWPASAHAIAIEEQKVRDGSLTSCFRIFRSRSGPETSFHVSEQRSDYVHKRDTIQSKIMIFPKIYLILLDITRKSGGANRDRTDDLLNAIQALSQLSYGPIRTSCQ